MEASIKCNGDIRTCLLLAWSKLHLFVYFMCSQTRATVLLWRSKDNVRELVLFLHSVDSRDRSQVTSLTAFIHWAISPARWRQVLKWQSWEKWGACTVHTLFHVVSRKQTQRAYSRICWNASFLCVLRKPGCWETDSGQSHGCQIRVVFRTAGMVIAWLLWDGWERGSCWECFRFHWDSHPNWIRETVKICHRRNDDP